MCAFFSTLLLNTFDIQSTCVNYRIITQWVRVRGRAHTAHRLPTSLTLFVDGIKGTFRVASIDREHFVWMFFFSSAAAALISCIIQMCGA